MLCSAVLDKALYSNIGIIFYMVKKNIRVGGVYLYRKKEERRGERR